MEALQDPGRLHFTGANLCPVTEQIKNRIALLFQFINNYLFTYHSEMRLPEEKGTSRVEKSYAIDEDIGEEREEEQNVYDEDDASGITTSASVMTISGKSNNVKELSSLQLEFNRDFADRVNKLTKQRTPDKMGKCPCNIQPNHMTKFGSARFCPKYLRIPDMEARRQFIRLK